MSAIVLTRTLPEVRAILRGELGRVGIPAPWWAFPFGQDCLGAITWAMGLRPADDLTTRLISIEAFRKACGWQQIRGAKDVRSGDVVLWDWDRDGIPDHAEHAYSVDFTHDELTTDSANTGPKPGVDIDAHPELRGFYEKTRPLSSPELWGVLRPPYAPEVTSKSDRAHVRKATTWLNGNMPAHFTDTATGRVLTLHRSGAGDIGTVKGDGVRGPFSRLMVQCWGRAVGLYDETYKLDAIYGPRSEFVDAELIKRHG